MSRTVFSLSLLFAATVVAVAAPTPAKSATAEYELRGFFGSGDTLEVSIRFGRSGTSQWLRVGERFGRLVILEADAEEGTVLIEADGIRRTLRLALEAPREPRRR